MAALRLVARAAGEAAPEVFYLLLTDNGGEFDAEGIEAVLPIVGQGFLDALGIEPVPRDGVVLKPDLISR